MRHTAHLCVYIRNLLDGASLSRTTMSRRDDAAISALAELLDELVFSIDLEFGIQGGEGASLHG